MKRLFVIAVLVFLTSSLNAQFFKKCYQMGKNMMESTADVDSNYIYQPPARITFALTEKLQRVGFYAITDYKIITIPVESTSHLGERTYKKLGFEVGYGNVSFGYDIEVDRRGTSKKKAYSFGYHGLKWGVNAKYFNLQNYFVSNIVAGEPGDTLYSDETYTSAEMGEMQNISVDGYYVFKHKRFAYTATNTVGIIQKRTTGSWMLTARFMWSQLHNKDDVSPFEYYSPIQFAIGGGYSVNFVLWNRNEINHDDRTVRNITLNTTILPVVSVINFLKTESDYLEYDAADSTEIETVQSSYIWCYPTPNLLCNASLCMTFGHLFFTTQMFFNLFYFQNQDAVNNNKFHAPQILYNGTPLIKDLSISGLLYEWTLTWKLVYRF